MFELAFAALSAFILGMICGYWIRGPHKQSEPQESDEAFYRRVNRAIPGAKMTPYEDYKQFGER